MSWYYVFLGQRLPARILHHLCKEILAHLFWEESTLKIRIALIELIPNLISLYFINGSSSERKIQYILSILFILLHGLMRIQTEW